MEQNLDQERRQAHALLDALPAEKLNRRAVKDRAASPAPIIDPSRRGTHREAGHTSNATSRPCRRSPTRARPCFRARRISGTAAAWEEISCATPASVQQLLGIRAGAQDVAQLIQVQTFTRRGVARGSRPRHRPPGNTCRCHRCLPCAWRSASAPAPPFDWRAPPASNSDAAT
jgi:hypothetical protein